MRGAQIGLFGRPKCVQSYRLICLCQSILNIVQKWRLWFCCYSQRLLLRKTGTCVRTSAIPLTIEDHKLVKRIWVHASRHIIIKTDGDDETGKLGTGKFTDVCLNFELWTWNWRGCCHAVRSKFRVFDVTRVALLVKSGDSRSKNKQVAILEPFDELCM